MQGRHLQTATFVFRVLEKQFGTVPMDSISPLELEKWIHSTRQINNDRRYLLSLYTNVLAMGVQKTAH
jgi:hypothetical protein